MSEPEVSGADQDLQEDELQALEKLLTSLERKPELVGLVGKLVPNTVVGGDSGFAGAAALLGASLGQAQQPAANRTSGAQ